MDHISNDHNNETYQNYRNSFLNALANSQIKNLKLNSVPIPGTGSNSEKLTQDHVYLNNGSTTTVVHLSGIHGVEGYIGSIIQTEVLKTFSDEILANKNLAIIHIVNPWGMSWNRRSNQFNVDLNRNSIDFKNQRIENPIFPKFFKLLRAKNTFEIFIGWIFSLYLLLKIGVQKSIQNIPAGQYDHPKDLFYGGTEIQKELKVLTDSLKKEFPDTTNWIVVDIHSGLGPRGFDTLIFEGLSNEEEEFFKSRLDSNHLLNLKRQKTPYYANGFGSKIFSFVAPNAKIFYLTQEFGTYPFFQLLSKLIIENQLVQMGKLSSTERTRYLVETYYPNDREWRKKSIHRGLDVFKSILK